MQTINLKFKKLDRLPVPLSEDETLHVKDHEGRIYSIATTFHPRGGRYSFEDELNDNKPNPKWTYAHVKVTSTETDFKVGDYVEVAGLKGFEYQILRIVDKDAWLLDTSSNSKPITPLTDLTLIPNETT